MANQDFNRSLYVGISLILGDKTRKVIKREQLPMEWVLYYTLNFLCEDSYHLATQDLSRRLLHFHQGIAKAHACMCNEITGKIM